MSIFCRQQTFVFVGAGIVAACTFGIFTAVVPSHSYPPAVSPSPQGVFPVGKTFLRFNYRGLPGGITPKVVVSGQGETITTKAHNVSVSPGHYTVRFSAVSYGKTVFFPHKKTRRVTVTQSTVTPVLTAYSTKR